VPCKDVGGVTTAGLTVTVTSEVELRVPSEAVKRITYVPEVVNVAVVEREFELEKVTEPPDITLHVVVRDEPDGIPSSEAVPVRVIDDVGSVIV
jgi:hypothetical protein